MKILSRYLVLLLLFVAPARSDDQKLNDLLDSIKTACLEGQLAVWADHIYEPMLAAMGGREKVRIALRGVQQSFVVKKMKLVRLDFVAPFHFVTGTERRYAVVPTVSEMSTPEGIVRDEGFQLAVETAPGVWKFFDPVRSVPPPGAIRKLLPDFPDSVKLPEHKRSVVPPAA